jgi:hypothetical protein
MESWAQGFPSTFGKITSGKTNKILHFFCQNKKKRTMH